MVFDKLVLPSVHCQLLFLDLRVKVFSVFLQESKNSEKLAHNLTGRGGVRAEAGWAGSAWGDTAPLFGAVN